MNVYIIAELRYTLCCSIVSPRVRSTQLRTRFEPINPTTMSAYFRKLCISCRAPPRYVLTHSTLQGYALLCITSKCAPRIEVHCVVMQSHARYALMGYPSHTLRIPRPCMARYAETFRECTPSHTKCGFADDVPMIARRTRQLLDGLSQQEGVVSL